MSCGSHSSPLGGRAGEPGTIKVVQLFGSVADSGDPYSYRAFDRQWAPWIGRCEGDEEGAYLVSSTAVEIVRGVARGEEDPVSPVPRSALESGTPPAGGTFTRRSQMKLRLRITREDGERWIDLDTGVPIELYAQQISVHRLTPADWIEVPPQGSTATADGLVVDLLVGVRIVRIENTIGYRDATLTEQLVVPANGQAIVPVPPGARRLHIQQSTAGAASAVWTRWYGEPTSGGIEVGSFPLANRVSGPVELGNATHLRPDADTNDRIFTLIWTVRP